MACARRGVCQAGWAQLGLQGPCGLAYLNNFGALGIGLSLAVRRLAPLEVGASGPQRENL